MRVLASAVLAVALAAGVASAATSVIPGPPTSFPRRVLVLSVPRQVVLQRGAVRVTENGRPVAGLRVQPRGVVRRGRHGVVFVIDATGSMAGRPLATALTAARALWRARDPLRPLALVVAGEAVRIAVPFTTDAQRIGSALEQTPTVAGSTRVLAAVDAGVRLIRGAGLRDGVVVVLSDGADDGRSVIAPARLWRSARAADVSVCAVGVPSPRFDARQLRALAAVTGGEYATAGSAAQLRRVAQTLGDGLSGTYRLEYRSRTRADARVRVTVRGLGVARTLAPAAVAQEARREQPTRSWGSFLAVVLPATLVAATTVLLVTGLATRRRERRV